MRETDPLIEVTLTKNTKSGVQNTTPVTHKGGLVVRVVTHDKEVCGFSKVFLERIVRESVERSGVVQSGKVVVVSVTHVSPEEMRALNKAYRGKDAPTDVLSFPEYSDRGSILDEGGGEMSIGDVVLSCDIIKKQAQEDGVTISRELAYLLSHGVLHLLGYNHEPEMFSIQDEICDILER